MPELRVSRSHLAIADILILKATREISRPKISKRILDKKI